jgi:hypothetical protein
MTDCLVPPPTDRRVQLRVGYAPGFPQTPDFCTPLANDQMTEVLTTREGGQSHIEPLYIQEDILDCTTEYLIDILVLHRYAKLTLELEVDATTLLAMFGLTLGAGSGNDILMLGPTVFALPTTSLVVGFADGVDPGILLSPVVASSLQVTGRVDQKLMIKWELVGSALMPSAGYVFPDCSEITPLRLDINTHMTVSGVDRTLETRSFDFNYNNNIPLRDFPWVLGQLDVVRLERGDKRTCTMAWVLEGRENDADGELLMAVPPTHVPWDLHLGPAIGGGIDLISANSLWRPNGGLQTWDGEVSIACLNSLLTPTRIPGNVATPLQVTGS